jgi:hypothetical protein
MASPAPPRTCSECGCSLEGRSPQTRTCSNACRKRRSARHAAINKRRVEEEGSPAAVQEIRKIVRNEAPDVITRVLGSELVPVVREALTEDVMRAINQMVGLTPLAVAALANDLESEDALIRQRAYTLLIKYTAGHPALVRPADTNPQGQLVVNFNLPRPDDAGSETEAVPADAEQVESRNCDLCGEELPETEFVAGSERCRSCFTAMQRKIEELYM